MEHIIALLEVALELYTRTRSIQAPNSPQILAGMQDKCYLTNDIEKYISTITLIFQTSGLLVASVLKII